MEPLSLLMVEDSAIVAAAIRRLLKQWGVAVTVSPSCAAARQAARSTRFSAALVDFELDDGSGIELAEWLLESNLVDRVLFYTGERSDHPNVRCAEKLGPVLSKAEAPRQILTALGLDANTPLRASERPVHPEAEAEAEAVDRDGLDMEGAEGFKAVSEMKLTVAADVTLLPRRASTK